MSDREFTLVRFSKKSACGFLAFLILAGCSRSIPTTTQGATYRGNAASSIEEPAAPQLRRLSNGELRNTILSLLGDTIQPALSLPPDEESLGYTNGYNIGVSQLFLDQWHQLARQVASQAVKAGSPLQLQNASCLARQDSMGCADAFIEDFGKRSFRRPLTPDESLQLRKVFQAGQALGSYESGQQFLIEAILLSPSFLYKTELGASDKSNALTYELTSYELAAQLAYAVTAYPPDAELMAAADSGAILDRAVYQTQAQRLMASEKGLDLWRDFIFSWLEIDAIDSIQRSHSQWADTLPQAFRAETEAFIRQIMTEENGSLIKLLSNESKALDPRLNSIYGSDSAERRGILTQGSFLSMHAQIGGSSPVRRGFVILQRLFCLSLPPPPPGVAVVPAENPKGTTRDRFAAHSNNASCKGCHSRMDPLGFAFENYDGLGVYRSQENGQAVDASGELTGLGQVDGAFNNGLELISRMAVSKEVHDCVTKQLFRYVMGRAETTGDTETLENSRSEAEGKSMDLRAALLSIVSSDQFKQRSSREPNP